MALPRPRTFRVVRMWGKEQQFFSRKHKDFVPVEKLFDGFENVPFQYIAKATLCWARDHARKTKKLKPKGSTKPALQYFETGVIKWENEK